MQLLDQSMFDLIDPVRAGPYSFCQGTIVELNPNN